MATKTTSAADGLAAEAIRLLERLGTLRRTSAASGPVLFPNGIESIQLKLTLNNVGSVELDISGAPKAAHLDSISFIPPSAAEGQPRRPRDGGGVLGVDTSTNTIDSIGCLAANSIAFVGRYFARSGAKRLTVDEAARLGTAGIKIVAVWEDGKPTSATYFDRAKGLRDGKDAHNMAKAMSQPDGTPIFFAVDYDASPEDINGVIKQYFEGVQAALDDAASKYKVGVYGSGRTCRIISQVKSLASYSWLAQSTGWAEHKSFSDWQIKQLEERVLCDIKVDGDIGSGDYGGWFPESA